MKTQATLLILLLIVPVAMADPIVEAHTVQIDAPFIAAWQTLDGPTQIGGQTRFTGTFGDSAPRLVETDSIAQAPIRMNLTGFRVATPVANCGDLLVGETITVTFRVNQSNSILTGSCTGGAAANSATVDNDVVEVHAGARLSISYLITGTVLTRNPRLGVTLIGSTNQTHTIPEVENMTIELTGVPDFLNATLTLLFLTVTVVGFQFGNVLVALGGAFATFRTMGFGWAEIIPFNMAISLILLGILIQGTIGLWPRLGQYMDSLRRRR